jgi:beta-ketodecanoyl-[acyl-carrier-protein] synthase
VCGRDPTPSEAPNVIGEHGNTSSSGALIVFNKYSADLNKDDVGVLCTFGAGYSAGSVILKKLT